MKAEDRVIAFTNSIGKYRKFGHGLGSGLQLPLLLIYLCQCKLVSANIACRTELGFSLPFEGYALDTCAKCYNYMPTYAFKGRLGYIGSGRLYDFWNNRTVLSNETEILSQTFQSPIMVQKWQECCHGALACCVNYLAVKDGPVKEPSIGPSCPRTWDGWTCWPNEVSPGSTVQQACAKHIYWRMTAPPCREYSSSIRFLPLGYATKTCTSDGTWFMMENREWTNYTNCARDDIYLARLRYSITTHLISVAFIIPALIIFNYYRQLSATPRIRLHKHLFACLLLYAILSSLLKLNLLQTESEAADQSQKDGSASSRETYCLILSLSVRYFRSTTYLWMFNEAFYLHQLIKRAFTQPAVAPLIGLAYGLPLIMTIVYVVCRALVGPNTDLLSSMSESGVSDSDACWLMPASDAWKEWVINGPNLCILLVNCMLLLPIIVEIYRKTVSAPSPSPHSNPQRNLIKDPNAPGNVSKASFMVPLRAATLLLPLYGLHYLVIVYRPDINICWLSELYHYSSLTLDGLQGSLVSILFCFANNEVRQLLKRSCFAKQDANNINLTEIVPAPQ